MARGDEQDVSTGSILRDLIFNQYQAILAGGAALASLVTLNPLPLLVWLGSELVLLPVLDSGPLRRLVARRKLALARANAEAERVRIKTSLTPEHSKRYEAMAHLCELIETNYQNLTGISQAYLFEQRQKLDVILQSGLHRLLALQRYDRLPATRHPDEIGQEIADLERELEQERLPERAAAALRKNVELKRTLLASVSRVGDTVRTLLTELDSMESLLELLHQNSISLRDPQAISQELDVIVRQSEESERMVREMEALLRADTAGLPVELTAAAGRPTAKTPSSSAGPATPPRRVKRR